jgi:hypothetical protein
MVNVFPRPTSSRKNCITRKRDPEVLLFLGTMQASPATAIHAEYLIKLIPGHPFFHVDQKLRVD